MAFIATSGMRHVGVYRRLAARSSDEALPSTPARRRGGRAGGAGARGGVFAHHHVEYRDNKTIIMAMAAEA